MYKKKEKTILLTAAGGVAMPFIIKHLKNQGYKVFTADIDKYAIGLYLSDKGFIIPKAANNNFLPTIHKICQEEKVDIVIPLVDEELLKVINLEKENIKVLTPQKTFINSCLDKFKLMKELNKQKIPIPKTFLLSKSLLNKKINLKYPVIIKPRQGRGSRGIQVINSKKELKNYINNCNSLNKFIVQTYIQGEEYTVSVVVGRNEKIISIVPKKIIHKKGVTKIAITEKNESIKNICKKIQQKLKANGPFNVQLTIDKKSKKPFTFEINPRFSTSTTLTIKSGVDEFSLLIEERFNKKIKPIKNWKENILLIRENKENFLTQTEFKNKYSKIIR